MALFLFLQILIYDMEHAQILGIILAVVIGFIAAGLIIGAILLGTRATKAKPRG